MASEEIIGFYERHAGTFDAERGRSLQEKAWLDRFLEHVPAGGTVLDIGCGMGEPMARYLLASGRHVVGIDASAPMIELCRERFPEEEWHVADMRALALERTFDGVLAWDSFFHLARDEQRAMFPRFAAHARAGAPLMFTSGTEDGEMVGSCFGDPLYHASLDTEEYRALLVRHGFTPVAHVVDDQACGGHTVWLARRRCQ